jgi:16S rRNA (cytosine967-C5)-methyltransferase
MTIYATDVRESVLENLKERFVKAKIKRYRAEKIDVANLPGNFILPTDHPLDGIVADVPCSGSGTWARTPEWLGMFNAASLNEFQTLQRQIVSNLARYLPNGKPLVYITCSVFKKENEDNLGYFAQHLHLTVENNSYIRGFLHGADTLFVARLVRSL